MPLLSIQTRFVPPVATQDRISCAEVNAGVGVVRSPNRQAANRSCRHADVAGERRTSHSRQTKVGLIQRSNGDLCVIRSIADLQRIV